MGVRSLRSQDRASQQRGETAAALALSLAVIWAAPALRARYPLFERHRAAIWVAAALAVLAVCVALLAVEVRFADFSITQRLAESLGTSIVVLAAVAVVLQWREQFGARRRREAAVDRLPRDVSFPDRWTGAHLPRIAIGVVAALTALQLLRVLPGITTRVYGVLDGVADAMWASQPGLVRGFPVGAATPMDSPALVGLFAIAGLTRAPVVWNVLVLVEFAGAAAAMWALTATLTRRHWIAALSAVGYAFGSAHVSTLYHAPTIFPWLPLFALSAVLVTQGRLVGLAVWVSCALLASLFVPGAFVAALLVMTAVIVASDGFGGDVRRTRTIRAAALGALALAGLAAIPLLYGSSAPPVRPTVSLSSFVLPPASTPLFGAVSRALGRTDALRPSVHAGTIPVAVAACVLIAVLVNLRRRVWRASQEDFRVLVWAGVAGVAGVGALLGTGAALALVPASIRAMIAPAGMAARVWAPTLVFAIVALAAIGGASIWRSEPRRGWVLLLVALGVLLDVLALPIGPAPVALPDARMRTVYERLGPDAVIANYPLADADAPVTSQYLIAQTVHRRPMLNGIESWSAADQVRRAARDLEVPGTASLLRSLGITHVVVHADAYLDGRLPAAAVPFAAGEEEYTGREVPNVFGSSGFALAFADARTAVLTVEAPPVRVWGDYADRDFYPRELFDGEPLRWMWRPSAAYVIVNATGRPQAARFVFDSVSVSLPRTLVAATSGGARATWSIPTRWTGQSFAFTMPPGFSVIEFEASPGPSRLGDVLGSDDDRRVFIGFRNAAIELTADPP